MTAAATEPVSDRQITDFRRDGAVTIRGVFNDRVESRAVDHNIVGTVLVSPDRL